MTTATAFAPATVGNAAVGFDVLGFAVDAVGDTVTVTAIDEPIVRIAAIHGVVTDLPLDPEQNTATVGLVRVIEDLSLPHGFEVTVNKGIPLGSGMGGSAASAVAAIVAANAVLGGRLARDQQFNYALAGEAVASGHAHPDNVAPCLFGGLTFAVGEGVRSLPTPDVWVALVHPHLRVDTKAAREVLPTEVPLATCVAQMSYLAAFVDACHRGDSGSLARACVDLLAEPHRKSLVKGFEEAKVAARRAGALSFSLSGSGPTVFALVTNRESAERVKVATVAAFEEAGVGADGWVSELGAGGAHLVEGP